MKRLLIALFSIASIAVPACAQYSVETINTGITYIANSATTNAYNTSYIDVRKTENVSMLLSFKLAGAGTGNVTVTLRPIVSASYAPTHAGNNITWVVAANGATTVNAVTNFTTTGYGWIELVSIANAGGDVLTNLVTQYTIKRY